MRWSDKPFVVLRHVGPEGARRRRTRRHRLRRPRRRSSRPRRIMGVVNPNSPLVWDWLMVDALMAVGRGATADRDDAVPAGRRDRAGLGRRRARASRWPRRSRAWPSPRPSGRARRASSARSSRPSTCAAAARRSARPSRCSAPSPAASSRAATTFRSAAAAASASANALDAQAASESLDVAVGHVPGRLRPRACTPRAGSRAA